MNSNKKLPVVPQSLQSLASTSLKGRQKTKEKEVKNEYTYRLLLSRKVSNSTAILQQSAILLKIKCQLIYIISFLTITQHFQNLY